MLPGLFKLFVHKFLQLISFESKMSLNNFLCQFLSLSFKDEKSAIRFSFFCDSLSCVILDNISSECVNWVIITAIEVFRQNSFVSVFPLSSIVIVSYKTMETGFKASEVFLGFFNSLRFNLCLINKSDTKANVVIC